MMQPFKLRYAIGIPGQVERELPGRTIEQSLVLEESPTCRLVQALHHLNLSAVQKAIEDGARIVDREFNALDYALGTKDHLPLFDALVEICVFLMAKYPELITEKNAIIVFSTKNDELAKALIAAVLVHDKQLAYKVFHMAISRVKPVGTTIEPTGHIDDPLRVLRGIVRNGVGRGGEQEWRVHQLY